MKPEEAIEVLKANYPDSCYEDLREAVDKAIKAMEAQEWVSCKERLPIKAGHYLCSFKKPNRIDRIHVDLAYWTSGRWYGYIADAITAWKPLPEPYKEET